MCLGECVSFNPFTAYIGNVALNSQSNTGNVLILLTELGKRSLRIDHSSLFLAEGKNTRKEGEARTHIRLVYLHLSRVFGRSRNFGVLPRYSTLHVADQWER